MRHFVMVDFNKGINIIKHNFLKRFCNVAHSGTVLHGTGGSSSAHARNMPPNMRDPKNYNFNTPTFNQYFLFHCNYRKKISRKMVSVIVLGTWNLEVLQKQNAAI